MKVVINGLGRIGRAVLKICLEKGVNVVAVNDLTGLDNLVYLLKYDSVYGRYEKNVSIDKDSLKIGNKKIKFYSEKNPEDLPWKSLGVDIVIEATGVFTKKADAKKHIKAGAKKVVISAPSDDADNMVVLGVNENKLKQSDKIISMGSCTTNCLAPIAKILEKKYGIKKGFMTTVHAYTVSQAILDSPSKKFRRGRAGAANIVPTTSGATKAVVKVLPQLKGKLDGLAMRVPVPCGSIVDFVVELKKKPKDADEVNNVLKKEARKIDKVLKYSEDELVSSDIIQDSHSSIVDSLSTQVIGNSVKVLSWYDNEYGYSSRLVDLINMLK